MSAAASPARGRALAAACLIAPLAIYAGVFQHLAYRLGPARGDVLPDAFAFAAAPGRIVADLAAREAFLLASAAMLVISVGALVYALAGLHRSHGRPGLAAGALAALAFGGYAAATSGNPWRSHLVDRALAAAAEADALFAPLRTQNALDAIVLLDTFLGIGAVGAMILRFASLALAEGDRPAARRHGAHAARLAARERAVARSLLAGALILTSAAVATRIFYHLPAALMEGEAAETHRALAALAATRWGAAYTAILVGAAAPAFLAVQLDLSDAVESGALTSEEAAPLSGAGALGGPARAIGAVAAALGPAAVGPLLGVLESALGAFAT